MTREEAKPYIGELQMYAKSRGWDEEYLIACDMAMNALEQEPVLDTDIILSSEEYGELVSNEYDNGYAKGYRDALENEEPVIGKIRAEIEKLRPNLRPEQMTDYDYAMVEVVDDIVAIIDRYKADKEKK